MMDGSAHIEVFWSKAAMAFAGPRLHELQGKVFEDVSGLIADGASGWFIHAVPPDQEDCLLCEGEESASEWRVHVRVAAFGPLEGSDGEAAEGPVIRFPRAVADEDNDLFARYWDLVER